MLLSFPVLVKLIVREEGATYLLRPLFVPYPQIEEERFERARQLLRREVRQMFRNFELNRDNLFKLLWFRYEPEAEFRIKDFHFQVEGRRLRKQVISASFELQGLRFVLLPDYGDHMLVVRADEANKTEIEQRIDRFLRKHYRKLLRDGEYQEENEVREAFLTSIKVEAPSPSVTFYTQRQQSANQFAFTMGAEYAFNGAIELPRVGEELSEKYPHQLGRAYYRDELVERLEELLFGPAGNSLVLLGPVGSGRHTLLEEVFYRHLDLQEGKDRQQLFQGWVVDPNRVIAGMSYVGQWEKRMEAIIDHLRRRKGPGKPPDKLIFDNPLPLLSIGTSASSKLVLGDLLKVYLEKRQLQVVLIATPEQWQAMQEKDRRFSNLFQVLRVPEATEEEAFRMMIAYQRRLEEQTGCVFLMEALLQIQDLRRGFYRSQALPGSLIRMLDQIATKHKSGMIRAAQVRREFSQRSGLQKWAYDSAWQIEPEEVENILSRQLVGQPEAVDALADVIHRVKARLVRPGKPIASFLFAGPTGMGKTQAAKVLSRFMLGGEDRLLRFDMNEYVDGEAVYRLIGTEHSEGQLTAPLRHQSFAVILLDEIEKAHPLIHDLMLQLLDDARLTDGRGRTTDFSQSVIIMTSNLGAAEAGTHLGFGKRSKEELALVYQRAVERNFRPELVNRIDRIVPFRVLEKEDFLRIGRIQIKELLRRDGFVRRTTMLSISGEALEWVAGRAYDPAMGGRALKRQIERDLTLLSADQLMGLRADQPIIMEIVLRDNKLHPVITPLQFAEPHADSWMPPLPEARRGGWFFHRMLDALQKMSEQLDELGRDPILEVRDKGFSADDLVYYELKEMVAEKTERIKQLALGFRDSHYEVSPAIPLRLKRVARSSFVWRNDHAPRHLREMERDYFFQKEAINDLRQGYHYANSEFNPQNTEFLGIYLEVSFLYIFLKSYLAGESGSCSLRFRSKVHQAGARECAFLTQQITRWMMAQKISCKREEDECGLTAEMPGLATLWSGQEGLHLFYLSQTAPLPIELRVEENGQGSGHTVLRLYDEPYTITDLRSGYSNSYYITPPELSVLLYAGLPAELRGEIVAKLLEKPKA